MHAYRFGKNAPGLWRIVMDVESVSDAPTRPYRVVQWATGNVGSRALRRAIEHPGLSLVGLYVHSPEKAGRDAGELAGIEPVGVAATNSIDDIIALRPDCVVYMPLYCNFDEVCRLLGSGANIVTTRGEFHNPASMDPAVRARVEEACRQGNSSIHSTGCSPGFVTEALPLVLATLERRLDHISINEYADCSSRDSAEMLFSIMGFGEKPGRDLQPRLDYLREAFGPSLEVTAAALGLPCDKLEVRGAVALARHDIHIAAGVVAAGTVAAQRTTVSALRGGKKLISFTANWYVSTDVETEDGEVWDLRSSGWHVRVDGDVPLDVAITYPVAAEDYAEMTPGLTAHRPLNMVAYVCEAPPGIRTSAELPQIIAHLGPGAARRGAHC
jgi:2,4-diaminopentanoate dehydrogenase